MVDGFYERLLRDPALAPLFLDVAVIRIHEHLPRIKAYWCKMLLGERGYQRHMMQKHRAVNGCQRFTAIHYERWLALFEENLDEGFCGPLCERARGLARRVAGNMRRNLAQYPALTSGEVDEKLINY